MSVRVIAPEHLVALPLKEKVRIRLQLQRLDLPLLVRQRPLQEWERPQAVEP